MANRPSPLDIKPRPRAKASNRTPEWSGRAMERAARLASQNRVLTPERQAWATWAKDAVHAEFPTPDGERHVATEAVIDTLATYANRDGDLIEFLPTIAALSNRCTSTTRGCIKRMVRAGVITRHPQKWARPGEPLKTRYHLVDVPGEVVE